jgi:hypothetical protein
MPKAAKKKIVLKDCPWCGYEYPRLEKDRDDDRAPYTFTVVCDGCDGHGPVMGGNADRGRIAWNHREGPPEMLNLTARGVPESVEEEVSDEKPEPQQKSAIEIFEEVEQGKVENPTPCPFCKSVNVHKDSGEVKVGKRKEPYFYTYCVNCDCAGPSHDTSEGFAVLAWNKRFP